MRTGGQILVDQLELNGADLAFCLPGESYLPVLDALYDSPIRLVTCRHEQGAANAAEAYGKLTGRPGICLVTRGPGATQAAVGVHTAKQDSSPMLLLVGQVPRAFRGREAWQELDYAQVFGGIAKAAWEIDGAERIPEHMAEAYAIAISGQAGARRARAARGRARRAGGRCGRGARRGAACRAEPQTHMARLRELLAAAERPLVVVGEGGWTAETSRDVQAFCEANALPVACAFRCQDYVDNRSSSYVGVLGVAMDEAIAARLRDADLVLAIGGRLGEVPTRRYSLLEAPDPRQTLVHVHPDPAELGRVYVPDLAIAATLPEAAAALRALEPVEPRWDEWTAGARGEYEANLVHEPMEGDVDLGEIQAFLRARLPGDAVQTCGAGNFTVWAHRFARVHGVRDAGMPALGLHGLRAAGGRRRPARPSRPRRRLLHGRRRLRHELAGARDGGAVRTPDRRPAREQRHVRDDPHASGTHLPAPRDRHGSLEPRLSRARTRVRGARASGSSGRRTSKALSSARSHPASRRCSSCPSTLRGSAHA